MTAERLTNTLTAPAETSRIRPLAGRRALISGGLNGMGLAVTERLAAAGASVVVADLASATDAPRDWQVRVVDATQPAAVAGLKEELNDGDLPIDILVNCVGIYPQASFLETSFELWQRIMSVNCDSMFLMSQAFAGGMATRGWGRIINVASNSFHGGDLPNYSAYIASKGSVIGLTRGMATDLGEHGVTVNAVAPGLVMTENMVSQRTSTLFEEIAGQQAIKRPQQPGDIAGAVAFLASEEAGFITGQTLVVDGGLIRV